MFLRDDLMVKQGAGGELEVQQPPSGPTGHSPSTTNGSKFHEPGANRRNSLGGVIVRPARQGDLEILLDFLAHDSVDGIMAAQAPGMDVVGVCGGSHCKAGHAELLLEAGGTKVFARMSEFGEFLIACKRIQEYWVNSQSRRG